MGNDFFERYKRPEWQKKSAEIRDRAGYACEWCEDTTSQLDVHHSYYEKDADPWDYPSDSLHCLCKKCHKEQQDLKREINRQFGRLSLHDMQTVLGFLQGLEMCSWPMVETEVRSEAQADGIGRAFGISKTSVCYYMDADKIDGFILSSLAEAALYRFRDVRRAIYAGQEDAANAIRERREREMVTAEANQLSFWEKVEPWNCAATG